MTIATPTPVDAEERLKELERQGEEQQQREKAREDAQFDGVRKKLLANRKVSDQEISSAIEIQRDEILPAAEKAELDKKRAADVRIAEGTAQEIRKVIEPAAEALETLAEQVRQLRPLLRKLTGQLQPLGRRLPNRCLSGQQIQWTIVGTLNAAWPGLVEPSLPHSLRGFEFGDLTLRDIDRTMRGLTTTEEGTP